MRRQPEPIGHQLNTPLTQTKTVRKHRWWLRGLRFAGLAYVLVLAMLVLMESRLVFPGAYTERRVASSAGPVVPFDYEAIDGSEITGRRLELVGSKRTVLFFHGNGTQAAWLDGWAMELSAKLKANVVMAEYRGFQDDAVTPGEENMLEDSLAAHQAVCDYYDADPEDIILYGRSLGGGCAAEVARQRGCQMLVLERTFDSVINVAANRFSIFPVRWLMKNHFDSVARLSDFRGNVVQIHGTADRVVPIEHGRRLHESIPSEKKVFVQLQDIGHNEALPRGTLESIEHWIGEGNALDQSLYESLPVLE